MYRCDESGVTWKGLCPFHGEKTPSFHVNGEKGFFHCFGCGLGGDVFKFVELYDKVGFPDAVRQLAGTCRFDRCRKRMTPSRMASRSASVKRC